MKKVLLGMFLVLLLASNVFAEGVTVQKLRISKAVMDDYAFTNTVKATSDSVKAKGNIGFASLVVDFDSDGGDLDIDMEVSLDNSTWYSPYLTDGSNLTLSEGVVDTLTSDRWIELNARLAPYIRFEFDPDSTCTVDSVYLIYQEGQ